MIMCGMSAAFSAIFGTPMAAAIFSMEMISIGVMYYMALVPCVISSLVAHGIAASFNVTNDFFCHQQDSIFWHSFCCKNIYPCRFMCIGQYSFCVCLHTFEGLYKKYITNKYLRAFYRWMHSYRTYPFWFGDQTYNGTGMGIIEKCIDSSVRPEAFILKIIFYRCKLGAGYKGGEIVPSFCIGAAFGCLFGNMIGFLLHFVPQSV